MEGKRVKLRGASLERPSLCPGGGAVCGHWTALSRRGPGPPALELADDTRPPSASQAPGSPLLAQTPPPGSSRPAGRWAALYTQAPRRHKAKMLCLEQFSEDPAGGPSTPTSRGWWKAVFRLLEGIPGPLSPWRESVRLGCPCCRQPQRSAQHALES